MAPMNHVCCCALFCVHGWERSGGRTLYRCQLKTKEELLRVGLEKELHGRHSFNEREQTERISDIPVIVILTLWQPVDTNCGVR
jgi:hypothetical protein